MPDKFTKITATNIPTAYDPGNAQSEMHTLSVAGQSVVIQNKTGSQIAYSRGEPGKVPSNDDGFVQAGGAVLKPNYQVGNQSSIFVRSDTGSPITDGLEVGVEVW